MAATLANLIMEDNRTTLYTRNQSTAVDDKAVNKRQNCYIATNATLQPTQHCN
jgi:hypothetical protein